MEGRGNLEYEVDEGEHLIRISGSALNLDRFAYELSVKLKCWFFDGKGFGVEHRAPPFNSETIEAMSAYESGRIDEQQMRNGGGFSPDEKLGFLHRLVFGIDSVNPQRFTLNYVADFDSRNDGAAKGYWAERRTSDWASVKHYLMLH